MRNIMLCDGDCGNICFEIDLFEVGCDQRLCDNCMSIFMEGQRKAGDGRD